MFHGGKRYDLCIYCTVPPAVSTKSNSPPPKSAAEFGQLRPFVGFLNFADLFCRFVGFLNFADLFCRFVGFL